MLCPPEWYLQCGQPGVFYIGGFQRPLSLGSQAGLTPWLPSPIWVLTGLRSWGPRFMLWLVWAAAPKHSSVNPMIVHTTRHSKGRGGRLAQGELRADPFLPPAQPSSVTTMLHTHQSTCETAPFKTPPFLALPPFIWHILVLCGFDLELECEDILLS